MHVSDRNHSVLTIRRSWLAAIPFWFLALSASAADEAPVPKVPAGQFVTVSSPIDDVVFNRISTTALKLQHLASQEGRPAVLVLQIEPGTSQFHHAQGLARFLTSAQVSSLTTVAWIPATVTGPNVLVALACKQIVMHPDAELGDIGRGRPLDPEEQQAVLALAQKRHNSKLNSAIVRGMMDKSQQLFRIRMRRTDDNKEELESRVVTKDEFETLRATAINIDNVEVVKEAGMIGLFRGSTARALDILVAQTAETRLDVATHYGLPREALREIATEKENRKVRLIKVEGVIDHLQEGFLLRQIERAVRDESQAIVFQIDSPGGLLSSSTQLAHAIADLQDTKIRTIAYVEREAISGAAIVALGCDEIYMLPEAKIGDAGPIEIQPGRLFERAPEKILSQLKAELRLLAEKKHRPIAICEAMADRLMKVYQVTHRDNGRVWFMSEPEIHATNGEWIQGPLLRETTGELLFTTTGSRAHELKIAESPVNDLDDLKARIGVPAGIRLIPVEKTWVDRLVFVLNQQPMVVLMITLGIALIYLELHFMTGILGILSVLCFSLFFWSNFMGGTAGWLEVVLFLLGVGCLALEIFVVPGFGVFGVSGILLVLASLVMACHSWSFDLMTNMEGLAWHTGQVILSMGLVGVMVLLLARLLPVIPGWESVVLAPPGSGVDEPRLRLATGSVYAGQPGEIAIGHRGVAMTMLRPAGKAQFENRVVDVISDGPFISAESDVEVVELAGNRIVVRSA